MSLGLLLDPMVRQLVSFMTEDNVVWRESGGSVTLECSLAKCNSSTDKFIGICLYHDTKEQEEAVLYYHSVPDNISLRKRYSKRVEKKRVSEEPCHHHQQSDLMAIVTGYLQIKILHVSL